VGKRDALSLAHEALNLVPVDPGRSVELASAAVDQARTDGHLEAASIAERALGLASLHVREVPEATRHLRTAIRLAEQGGLSQLAAEARMTFAFVLNRSGAPRRALVEIGAALNDLGPHGHAQGLAQRAAILQQLGRLDEALSDYRASLPTLRREQDLVWVQRVLLNRGVLNAFRHNYSAAARDLHEAERICKNLGLVLPAAFVHENQGLVSRRLGDVPGALLHLDAAEALYASLGASYGSLLVERSEVLLSVGLFVEARAAAEQAVGDFTRSGRRLSVPEARLLLARTALLTGAPEMAASEAARAVREFARQDRPEWVALARANVLMAQATTQPWSFLQVRRLVSAAEAAQAAGWPATAVDLRLLVGQGALTGRQSAVARDQLELVSAGRRQGSATRRAKAWLATALLRQHADDRRGSNVAARRGLEVLDDYRATMAATDLRAHVSRLGTDLAQVGLSNAVAAQSADQLLVWAERWRARHLLERPVVPPEDVRQSTMLAELRGLVAEQMDSGLSRARRSEVERNQVALERAIRDHSRRQTGSLRAFVRSTSIESLADALADAVLLEFVEVDDNLYGVSLVNGRTRLALLGPQNQVRDLVRRLQFGLSRLIRPGITRQSVVAAMQLLRHTGQELGEILLTPLAVEVADRRLVIVPTGILQSVPWALLPPVRATSCTVSPSAALWLAANARPAPRGQATVVAGPGLPGAHQEAITVAEVYGTKALVGDAATVANFSAALRTTSLVHVAAHGLIRADNPLFSSLQLADGPLTVYELERLDSNLDTVVLAACESGRDVVLAGDEMLGLSAAFLSRRTRTVVASVVPVPDAETGQLMVAFHQRLATGTSAAAALSAAQQSVDPDDAAAVAAAAGFVCIGAGHASGAPPG
jgi:tetratricopeptide (TPR) repeat protein